MSGQVTPDTMLLEKTSDQTVRLASMNVADSVTTSTTNRTDCNGCLVYDQVMTLANIGMKVFGCYTIVYVWNVANPEILSVSDRKFIWWCCRYRMGRSTRTILCSSGKQLLGKQNCKLLDTRASGTNRNLACFMLHTFCVWYLFILRVLLSIILR